ncbi:MAG: hypothetical protein MUF64_05050 [Polyangiaceae bacterium]|nr:hypothetical protein [Polyangiaceae bacterium]
MKARPRLPRAWGAVALLLASLLTAPLLAGVSAARRATLGARRAAVAPVTRLLPWPDLAVASGARHLRFLSLEEPGAAFADGPASLDTDPAGGAVAPPRAVWAETR